MSSVSSVVTSVSFGYPGYRHETEARDPVVALRVRGLSAGTRVREVSLDLHRGEILGLWGMPGAGRTELLRALYGLDPVDAGTIEVAGREVGSRSPTELIRLGVGLSPDDRKRDGVVLELSVAENLVMACPQRIASRGIIADSKVAAVADEQIERLAIKVPSPASLVRQLSGGNQQKVVVGKWLAAGVAVLLMDEPTKGIDVEAKAGLYTLLRELADVGVSIMIAPTELEELFLACDRVLVLRRGRVVTEMSTAQTKPATVMSLAMGGHET